MIRFWVTAPNGAEIVNLGIIDKAGSFGFVAQQNGTYTFNFENDLPGTVQVTFTYAANPELPNDGTGVPLSYIVIIGSAAVVGSLLIIFVVRLKTKKVVALQRTELQK